MSVRAEKKEKNSQRTDEHDVHESDNKLRKTTNKNDERKQKCIFAIDETNLDAVCSVGISKVFFYFLSSMHTLPLW